MIFIIRHLDWLAEIAVAWEREVSVSKKRFIKYFIREHLQEILEFAIQALHSV